MTDHTADFLACYPAWYGSSYAKASPDHSKCCAIAWSNSSWRSDQCSRKNGHGPHGAYCKQHDPVARKAKTGVV